MRRAALLPIAACLLAGLSASAAPPIRLASGTLDPDSPAGHALARSRPEGTGPRLHLVQLRGAVLPEWVEALREAGLQPVDYIPENAYLVWGDEAALSRMEALQRAGGPVSWSGAWAPELKVDAQTRAAAAGSVLRNYAVQLHLSPAANAPTLGLIAQLRAGPELLRMQVLGFLDIVVPLPPEAVAAIAQRPDVVSVRLFRDPVRLGERDAQIAAGNLSGGAPAAGSYLSWLAGQGFTQAQFTSSGFKVDVADSGVDNGTTSPNHPGLKVGGSGSSRVAYARLVGTPSAGSTMQGCDGHGTLSAHVLAGYDDSTAPPHADASGFRYGLGVCPFVSLGSSVIFDPHAYTHPDTTELVSRAYSDGARLSSNGWGNATAGEYDILAQAYDALARDAQPSTAPIPAVGNQEMTFVFAAGNGGPEVSLHSPGSAKNVLTVGAAEGVQTFGAADQCGVSDDLASSANDVHPASSRGPAADGRAKPDLVAPGTHVSGGVPQAASPGSNGTALDCYASGDAASITICGGPGTYPDALYFPAGQQLFTASSGTSMAAAVAAGAAALVRQRFLNVGLPAPSPAMTKAILMNSARYLTGAGGADVLPSPAQGMGEVDLGAAFDRAGGSVGTTLRDQAANDLLTSTGQSRIFIGGVKSSARPVRVTLAWTDAPGSTAGSASKNDLDLTVTIGGAVYRGNVFSGAASATGGSADRLNNVESVFLPAGTSGMVTVAVTAASINSDGVPGNGLPLDQDFALVVYNVLCDTPAPTAGSNSPICAGNALNLSASGQAGATWSWSGPNGFTSSQQNPTISSATAAASGTYSVTQTVDGCTSPPATVDVVVTAIPAPPSLGSNAPVCAGSTLQLTASGVSGATYSWTGPNGFTSTSQDPTIPSVTAANAGTYTATQSVSGCTSAASSVNVVVNAIPSTPVAGSNSPLNAGDTLQLTANTVTGGSYSWTGPNGFTSALQNPTITNVSTAAAGTYSVTVTAYGCTSAAGTTVVSVRPGSTGPRFYPVSPCRVVDTRNANGAYGGPALAAGNARTFAIGGRCGVPTDAKAVAANVTVTGQSAAGSLRVYPSTTPTPIASTISYPTAKTRANNGIAQLGGVPGTIVVYVDQPNGTVHFIFDVSGYFR